jgi:hypothetical protein
MICLAEILVLLLHESAHNMGSNVQNRQAAFMPAFLWKKIKTEF